MTGACDDRISYGCTAIVAPDGRVVMRVPELEEGVVVFDLPDIPLPAGRTVS